MVMRRKARRAPRRRRAVGRRPRRMFRRKAAGNTPEYASCKVVRDLGYDSNGVVYKLSEFGLTGFPRAINVAQSYQYFRMKLVELKFIPTSDTYISGNPGEIPNLYYMIDKTDSIPTTGTTLTTLQQAGAKPIRFDDKTITVRFKPAVVWKSLDENGSNINFGLSRVSPWLATNDNNTNDTASWTPSSVDHHGIVYTVTGGVGGQNYHVEMVTHFEFKKPLYYSAPTGNEAPVLEKILNATSVQHKVNGVIQ